MEFFKTERFIVISAFLMIALVAVTECKRGGGGGRIFRATVLKERRNSRRNPRDVHDQELESALNTHENYKETETPTGDDLLPLFNTFRRPNTPNLPRKPSYGSNERDLIENEEKNDYFLTYNSPNTEKPKTDFQKNSEEEENSYTTSFYSSEISGNTLLDNLFKKTKHENFNSIYFRSYDAWKNYKRIIMSGLPVWDMLFGFIRHSRYVYNSQGKSVKGLKHIILPRNLIVPCEKNDIFFCPPNTVSLCTAHGQILCSIYKDQKDCSEDSEVLVVEGDVDSKNALCVTAMAILHSRKGDK